VEAKQKLNRPAGTQIGLARRSARSAKRGSGAASRFGYAMADHAKLTLSLSSVAHILPASNSDLGGSFWQGRSLYDHCV